MLCAHLKLSLVLSGVLPSISGVSGAWYWPFLSLLDDLITISFPKMYEFATGHWLFRPEAKDGIPRDIDHLAQMIQRTGQDHSDVSLKQYEIRKKQDDLGGKETSPKILQFIHLDLQVR